MSNEDNLAQLAAAFNDHQITDEEGQISGETETPIEEPALEEQTDDEKSNTEVSDRENQPEPKKEDEHEEETDVAEDESGKKYVPEKRFSKVYGKLKETERELQAIKNQQRQGEELLREVEQPTKPQKPLPKAELLEIEILRMQEPEFDPTSKQYSAHLDQLGGEIFRANPGITRLEAARRAKSYAASLMRQQVEAKEEVRAYKQENSDQGITNRVVSRSVTVKKPEEMTLEEMEAHLKTTGNW